MAVASVPPPAVTPLVTAERLPLVQRAVDALLISVQAADTGDGSVIEERSVFRPDSWLIQRTWEALADAGAVEQSLRAAQLAASRQPLAPAHCLYRLSLQAETHFGLAYRLTQELTRQEASLFSPRMPDGSPDAALHERLLYVAATAANLNERYLAFACLERADQFSRPWDTVIVQPDQRTMLARTILLTGLQPLTKSLLTNALRRYSDAGAQFVLEVVSGASEQLQRSPGAKQAAKLLALGVNGFRNATLTSLHGRRLTATVFSQAALVDDVLSELTAIANIQAARRESGLSLRKGDPSVLRQVKRPTADADVDFQVYTMSESVRNMPLRQMPREDRIELSNRLALLGTQSDGWTAAGAAATLVDLGAIKFAVEVVEKIPPNDPTRAEGFISLVRGLLEVEEPELAEEQMQRGLEWARTYPGRNPERALIWGLAESYLERKQTDKALALLDSWKEPTGFFRWLGHIFNPTMSDDELRNNGLRLRALLMDERSDPREIQNLAAKLRTWAPRLLDGEALVNFLLEYMIGPLLESGRTSLAMTLLPALQVALRHGSGEKHAMRVNGAVSLLLRELAPPSPLGDGAMDQVPVAAIDVPADVRAQLEEFLTGIWDNDARRGLWQTIHGIEGSLPLIIALDGPEAAVTLAQKVDKIGAGWA